MSKQTSWQRRNRAAGRCAECGAPSPEKYICDTCARRAGYSRRHPTSAAWAAVDWAAQTNKEIAYDLGVTAQCVGQQRRRAAERGAA